MEKANCGKIGMFVSFQAPNPIGSCDLGLSLVSNYNGNECSLVIAITMATENNTTVAVLH